MLYGDEVVPVETLDTPGLETELSERELKMAEALIESLTEKFDPDRHEDTYREKVMELIRQKDEGEEIVVQRRGRSAGEGRRPHGRARSERAGGTRQAWRQADKG